MVRIPTHREPTHAGEMLLKEFLNPMGLTPEACCRRYRCPLPAGQRIGQWSSRNYSQHGSSAREVLGNDSRFLAQPTAALGSLSRLTRKKKVLQRIKPVCNSEAT